MTLRLRVSVSSAVGILLIVMAACGGGGPSSSPSPTPTPTPSLQSVTVSLGTPSIYAGGAVLCSATGNYSDGSTQNLTSSATWSSSNPTVATVSATGLATTFTEGTATISATFESIAGSALLTATHLIAQVTVVASDSAGHPLTYAWQSTDGSIQNVNAATTTWTLPDGPGLHFAYVLVSNGFGGYTEERVAVDTDGIGTPLIPTTPVPFSPPVGIDGPTLVDIFRGFMTGGQLSTVSSFPGAGSNWNPGIPVSVPDMPTFAEVNPNATAETKTNVRGEFVIPGGYIPSFLSSGFTATCSPSGLIEPINIAVPFQPCGTTGGFGDNESFSVSDYFNFDPLTVGQPPVPDIAGEVLLQDGSTCGIVDEFFGVELVPTATVLDGSGNILAGPVRVNQWGDYDLPYFAEAASVSLQCENNSPVVVSIPTLNTSGTTELAAATVPASAPSVTSMTAVVNGTLAGQLLPPPTQVPSDIVPLGDAFLAEKGVDTRIGACQYYKAVGAVQSCDAAGNFSGAITFDDWKSQVNIDQYALTPPNPGGGPVYEATYINKVDLNLARNHHSVVNGAPPDPSILNSVPYTYVANYVCNHSGPGSNPGQQLIDSVIQNTVNGQNLVACVAMDYSTFPVPASNQFYGPFIRFLIFGPSGQLLPSVNLDGRREKFVPGTCVVCHGGDHYAGKYPEDGSGNADVGAHFLPYDTGNFEFSDQAGLTEAAQEQSIYNLNQNAMAYNALSNPMAYNPGTFVQPNPISSPSVTAAEIELITNWYGAGQVLNKSYVEPNWMTLNATNSFATSTYQNLYARSCRTCHVALPNYNFEQNPGQFRTSGLAVDPVNCGGGANRNRMYKMPNSLTTFNLFWGSHAQGFTGGTDQVALFYQFLGLLECPTDNQSAARTRTNGAHKP